MCILFILQRTDVSDELVGVYTRNALPFSSFCRHHVVPASQSASRKPEIQNDIVSKRGAMVDTSDRHNLHTVLLSC